MAYGFDALLYNPENSRVTYDANRVEKLKNNFSKEISVQTTDNSSFEELLKQELKPPKLNHIPSSAFSSSLSRAQVFEHMKENPERKKLYEAALQFESFFVEKMFTEMKKNVPKNELFHGGAAEEIFDDMLLTERVKKMSQNSEMGLAEMIYKQLQNI